MRLVNVLKITVTRGISSFHVKLEWKLNAEAVFIYLTLHTQGCKASFIKQITLVKTYGE